MNLQFESISRCPICDQDEFTHWLFGRDILHKMISTSFEYARCNSCSTVFLTQRIRKTQIGAIYPDSYSPYLQPPSTEPQYKNELELTPIIQVSPIIATAFKKLRKLLKLFSQSRLKSELGRLQKPAYPQSKLLDFGCGSSAFLDKAKSQGWATIGMDFNPSVIESVSNAGHRCILYSDETSWENIEDNSITVARLNHVIEHLYNPREVLSEILKKLAPGGTLYISTPNTKGISAKRFGSNWRGLECPRHVILYCPHSLTKLTQITGYCQQKILFEDTPQDYIRSLGLTLAEGTDREIQEIEQLPQNVDLFNYFSFKTTFFAQVNRGDRIHLFAQKPNHT